MSNRISSLAAALVALAPVISLLGACGAANEPVIAPPPTVATTKAAKRLPPVGLAAKQAVFHPGPASTGGRYSCALVTITNRDSDNLEVNPLYFGLTSVDGGKHTPVLGEADGEFDLVTLATGEHATGIVCAGGSFTPKTVSFNRDGFGTTYTAPIAR